MPLRLALALATVAALLAAWFAHYKTDAYTAWVAVAAAAGGAAAALLFASALGARADYHTCRRPTPSRLCPSATRSRSH